MEKKKFDIVSDIFEDGVNKEDINNIDKVRDLFIKASKYIYKEYDYNIRNLLDDIIEYINRLSIENANNKMRSYFLFGNIIRTIISLNAVGFNKHDYMESIKDRLSETNTKLLKFFKLGNGGGKIDDIISESGFYNNKDRISLLMVSNSLRIGIIAAIEKNNEEYISDSEYVTMLLMPLVLIMALNTNTKHDSLIMGEIASILNYIEFSHRS